MNIPQMLESLLSGVRGLETWQLLWVCVFLLIVLIPFWGYLFYRLTVKEVRKAMDSSVKNHLEALRVMGDLAKSQRKDALELLRMQNENLATVKDVLKAMDSLNKDARDRRERFDGLRDRIDKLGERVSLRKRPGSDEQGLASIVEPKSRN